MNEFIARLKASLARTHKSFTIWFNGAMGMVVIFLPMAQDNLPQLQAYLPENAYKSLMAVVVVGNILLRFKTVKALRDK